MSDFKNLFHWMEHHGVTYDQLSEKDRALYDELKRRDEESKTERIRDYLFEAHIPRRYEVALADRLRIPLVRCLQEQDRFYETGIFFYCAAGALSHIASYSLRYLIHKSNRPGRYFTARQLFRAISEKELERDVLVENLAESTCWLLVDSIGCEPTRREIGNLVYDRYVNQLPTLLTSTASRDELRQLYRFTQLASAIDDWPMIVLGPNGLGWGG